MNIADIPNYRSTINAYVITNAVETRIIRGTKTWLNDTAAERPGTITAHLLQNGVPTGSPITVPSPTDPDNVTPFSFPEVPRFDAQGAEFVYTVDEDPVADYDKTISASGYDITNTRQNP